MCCVVFLQSDAVANHPNLWFQTSVNYHKLKNGKPINTAATSSGSSASDSIGASDSVGEAVKNKAEVDGMKMET